MMTPNAIEILLHCYTTPVTHPRIHAPAVRDELRNLCRNGLIESTDSPDTYRTTERGCAHIRQLCDTPWPTQQWADASGKVIQLVAGETLSVDTGG